MHKSLVNQSPLFSAITFERLEIRQNAYTQINELEYIVF